MFTASIFASNAPERERTYAERFFSARLPTFRIDFDDDNNPVVVDLTHAVVVDADGDADNDNTPSKRTYEARFDPTYLGSAEFVSRTEAFAPVRVMPCADDEHVPRPAVDQVAAGEQCKSLAAFANATSSVTWDDFLTWPRATRRAFVALSRLAREHANVAYTMALQIEALRAANSHMHAAVSPVFAAAAREARGDYDDAVAMALRTRLAGFDAVRRELSVRVDAMADALVDNESARCTARAALVEAFDAYVATRDACAFARAVHTALGGGQVAPPTSHFESQQIK